MKSGTGLVLGLGIGFVLGAKTGRERYGQMKAIFESVHDKETFSGPRP